jgi:hypothetical protein
MKRTISSIAAVIVVAIVLMGGGCSPSPRDTATHPASELALFIDYNENGVVDPKGPEDVAVVAMYHTAPHILSEGESFACNGNTLLPTSHAGEYEGSCQGAKSSASTATNEIEFTQPSGTTNISIPAVPTRVVAPANGASVSLAMPLRVVFDPTLPVVGVSGNLLDAKQQTTTLQGWTSPAANTFESVDDLSQAALGTGSLALASEVSDLNIESGGWKSVSLKGVVNYTLSLTFTR